MSEATAKGTKCCQRVTTTGVGFRGFHFHQCTRNAVATEEGKAYCKQHLPSERKKRDQQARKRYDEKYQRELGKHRSERDEECANALAGIPSPAEFVEAARLLATGVLDTELAAESIAENLYLSNKCATMPEAREAVRGACGIVLAKTSQGSGS